MEIMRKFHPIPLDRLLQMETQLVPLLFTPKKATLGEVEHKAVETAAGFLARQMES